MQTSFRNNALAKNRLLLKLLLVWALSSTAVVFLLSLLSAYVLMHKETHWLPMCTGAEFSIGNAAYSPAYLKNMTEKVADLRLTYNHETVDARNALLMHLVPINHQAAFKKLLDAEQKTVHVKNISSVFYAEHVSVDMNRQTGQISGLLYRTSHGLPLKPRHKTYQLNFSFKNGLLGLESIKEINDANE